MLIFNASTPQSTYADLFLLKVGDIIKVESDFETVIRRIEEYTPQGETFEVTSITPGTSLFTMYGDSHCIVTATSL